MSRMLALDSAKTTYTGLDPNVVGFGALTAAQQPRNFYGYTGRNGVGIGTQGRYLFSDKTKVTLETAYESWAPKRNGLSGDTRQFAGVVNHVQVVYMPWEKEERNTRRGRYEAARRESGKSTRATGDEEDTEE